MRAQDVVRICDYLLVFCDDIPVPTPDPDGSSIDVTMSRDDDSAQPAEKLQRLLEITNRLSHTLDLDALLPQVVETLLQIFKQADRSFLILVDEATGELDPRIYRTRWPDEESPGYFSTRVVEESLKKVQGLISNEPGYVMPHSASPAGPPPRSVMCAPLWSKESKAIGVLLVESHKS